jgi:hypothetical protein
MGFPFRGLTPVAEDQKAEAAPVAPAEDAVDETPAAADAPATDEEKDS